jgi:DNA polymerase-3 subunit gamma/tau
VTVLSRCQRFDLRRVESAELARHLARIAGLEGTTAEPEALALIARAAEGSVRDGLSILDQAISMSGGTVDAGSVRAMLGLADRGRILDLMASVLAGAAGEALGKLRSLHQDGADPAQILADLAAVTHQVTMAKVAGPAAAGESLGADDRKRIEEIALRVAVPHLSRLWQMLLKGYEEAQRAPSALAAAEMVLVRLTYVADLPAPDEIIRALGKGWPGGEREAAAPAARTGPSDRPPVVNRQPPPEVAAAPPEPPPWEPDEAGADEAAEYEDGGDAAPASRPTPRTFEEVADLAGERRDMKLKLQLEDHVSLVRFEPGRIEVGLLPGAQPRLAGELSEKLLRWTGRRWIVAVTNETGQRPIGEARRERAAREVSELESHPAVKAVLQAFPDSEIKEVRPLGRPQEDDSATG